MAGVTEPDRWRHLAEGNARQARKRVAANVLIRDAAGRALLVNPTYKDFWDLPGGMAEANEPPCAAAERELREELGLTITTGSLLALDWVAAHGPWDDQLVFVFDGGTLSPEQTANLRPTDAELEELTFAAPHEAGKLLRPDVASLLERARSALADGTVRYTERPGYVPE
ncbi:NUDIX hydrolase [Prauserella halophila]|uniref:NUDIX hydrolase n=1 Tax=Prauserella halophila TaxID=185641 RepID=A0ABP4H4R8_9PSEU|nr:NUDIX hydrolase [Prauserella halophila]MCP2236724.1 ADP-ribose pyrophosphatase YjhB, NUDIX family [Prauserella halophila]